MEMFGLLNFLLLALHTSAESSDPGLVKEIINVEKKMTWYNAKNYCLNNSGQLFVASDKNELKNLSSSVSQLSWMGIYKFSTAWYWVDETKSNYFNWYGECAAMSKAGHWFYNTTCDTKLFFVCKKDSGAWDLVKEKKTWLEAKQQCETDHAGLAIIRNDLDNNLISAMLNDSLAWFGLATVKEDTPLKETWRWIGDNEPVIFSQWLNGFFCAVIDWRGFWHDRVCFEEHPFVCFRKVNSILEFRLVNEIKSWKEAQTHCNLLSMSLVMVKTQAELTSLVVYIHGIDSSFLDNLYFWIGLYNKPWYSANGLLTIQYWNSMQPDNLDFMNRTMSSGQQACGALKDGELFDELCIRPLPVFCMAKVRSMILVSEPKSWIEALTHCRDRYVDLASLTSAMEQHTAENKVQDVQSDYVWIGLNFLVGSWIWVYGDDVQYKNWVNGGNLQCPVARRCGALSVANGMWEARLCEERLEFLCFKT